VGLKRVDWHEDILIIVVGVNFIYFFSWGRNVPQTIVGTIILLLYDNMKDWMRIPENAGTKM
jgi:hypothetical protein